MSNEHPVKYIKLNNGEDIIASIVNAEPDSDIEIIDPIKIEYYKRKDYGGLALTFAEWIMGIQQETIVSINKDSILTMVDISEDLTNYYKRFIIERQAVMESNDIENISNSESSVASELIEDEDELVEAMIEMEANTEITYH